MQKNAHFADKNEWREKCVTVFGLNRSGLAVAELLVSLGATVAVTDTRTAKALATEMARYRQFAQNGALYLGGHPEECIADAERIVVSPGVPLDIPILREARVKNIPIWGELEVSARRLSRTYRGDYGDKRQIDDNAVDSRAPQSRRHV